MTASLEDPEACITSSRALISCLGTCSSLSPGPKSASGREFPRSGASRATEKWTSESLAPAAIAPKARTISYFRAAISSLNFESKFTPKSFYETPDQT